MVAPDAGIAPALLVLFNGVDPAREREYDDWHSREHVPERLTLPGWRAARRYVDRTPGVDLAYLTLYELDSAAALQSAEYAHLQQHPTPWSASMRPSFRGFDRVPCEVLASCGAAGGGELAVVQWSGDAAPGSVDSARALRSLCARPGVTAACLARHGGDASSVAWAASEARAPAATAGVRHLLFVEAVQRRALESHDAVWQAALAALGARSPTLRHFTLLNAFGRR